MEDLCIMALRIISSEDVKIALNMEKYIELVIEAHRKLQQKEAYQPLRMAMIPPQAKGILATMPAYLGGSESVMGLKVVSVFHDNHKHNLESHQGLIILVSPNTGVPEAIIDAKVITAMRTAAASAAATKYLAKKNATRLAIIGAGIQAHTHLDAISRVRNIKKVTIWNRNQTKAESFSETHKDNYDIKIAVSLEEAVRDAEIICTVTASNDPLLTLSMIKQGTHINAVGSATPNSRELSSDLISASSLFTDVYESAMKEAGDIVIPIHEGLLEPNPKIIVLGDLITEGHPGREDDTEITVYKSLGVGIQDLVIANYVNQWAKKNSKGTTVDFN